MHLGRTVIDTECADIAKDPLNFGIGSDTHAAEHLYATIDNSPDGLRSMHFDHAALRAGAFAGIE
ncbi:hypothetical protein D3C81_2128950 [compost metagenome]